MTPARARRPRRTLVAAGLLLLGGVRSDAQDHAMTC